MNETRGVIPSRDAAAVVLFDGVCNLCNGSVQFIIKRDPNGYFLFAALQSSVGQRLLEGYGIAGAPLESIVLVEDGRVFHRSDAVLRIAAHLTGAWSVLSHLTVVPRALRDRLYDLVVANRYRWFGRKEECMLPTPAMQKRFLR